jgi:hypothetical protein
MTKLEEIALAIFQKVASDPEASWDAMADEEREDALEWARAGLEVAREPSAEMLIAGRKQTFADTTGAHMGPSAERTHTAMIDAILNENAGA